MIIPRRRFLHLAMGAAALPAASRKAGAQIYPARPVRIIVGWAAGGGSDIAARLIGQWLSERLGQQFIIENRQGASGSIATESVVRAPPDGYTLLLADANATFFERPNYNFIRDIAPIAGFMRVPFVLDVNPSVPAKTVSEFIAYAKANPGRINMASAGTGGVSHVYGELFKFVTGVGETVSMNRRKNCSLIVGRSTTVIPQIVGRDGGVLPTAASPGRTPRRPCVTASANVTIAR
jgi:tripartite-type tricarboxylate transporter receptor subunit TctC